VADSRASHHVWNSAKIWYVINKNANKTNADSKILIRIFPAFLNLSQFHPSVIYRYHDTITIITIITQYKYPNSFAIFIIKSEAFFTNVELSAAR
jgi:hypothetical protein